MAAAISRNVIAADQWWSFVVVIAKDANGNCTFRVEDAYGARDFGVTQAELQTLAANITAVANA